VSYVDAGYAIVLVVLTLYASSLFARRRRTERAAERAAERNTGGGREGGGTGDAGSLGAPATHRPLR
jgi:hypothetical protein